MQTFLKYLFVLVCVSFVLVSCNSEVAEPTSTATPTTKNKQAANCGITYLTSTFAEVNPGTVVTPTIGNSRTQTYVKTFSYEVKNSTNTSRTYLTVSGFDNACSCWSSEGGANGCQKLIIKDAKGKELLNTDCQTVNKFVKVPGTKFTVTLNTPCWISNNASVNIEVMNW